MHTAPKLGREHMGRMVACHRCGTENASKNLACSACGAPLPAASTDRRSGTVVIGSPKAVQAPPSEPPAYYDTLLGVAPPGARPDSSEPPVGEVPGSALPGAEAGVAQPRTGAAVPQPQGARTEGDAGQPAPPRPAGKVAKPTLVGIAPSEANDPGAPSLQRTQPGLSPVPPPRDGLAQQPPRAGPGRGERAGTMIGVAPAPVLLGSPAAELSAAAQDAPDAVRGPGAAPAAQAHPGSTLKLEQVAAPATVDAGPDAPTPPPPANGSLQPPTALPNLPSNKRTKAGVAVPGVAPLQPEVAKPRASPPPPPPATFSAPPPDAASDPTALASRDRGRGLRAAAVGAVVVAGLLGLLIVLAVVRSGQVPLHTAVVTDESGKEQLRLRCDACGDGTEAKLGGQVAAFSQGVATLPLTTPLQVGVNQLAVTLTRPDGDSRDVELTVPVQYRVSGSFEGLAQSPPTVHVQIEAVRGTTAVIDGKPITLDGEARGEIELDVSKELTGPAGKVERLERRIAYTVTPPGAQPQQGEVVLQICIVPLQVEAPGDSIVVETPTFMLAGRTAKGGKITVHGHPITVDPSGRFAQLMNVSAEASTTIIVLATAPDRAPRLQRVRVRRVRTLREAAQQAANRSTRNYAAIATDIDAKRGWAVALEGVVVEARAQRYTSVILLDVTRGCPQRPCLARVLYGAKFHAESGARICAYGRLLGAVDGPRSNSRIPDVRADFVLDGRGP